MHICRALIILLCTLCSSTAFPAGVYVTAADRHSGQLTARQALPEDADAWMALGQETLALPRAAWQVFSAQLPDAVRDTDSAQRALLLTAELLWLGFIFWLYRQVKKLAVSGRFDGHSFLGRLLRIVHELMRGNRINIAITGMALIFLPLAAVPWPSVDIVPILILAWLCYWLAVDLACLLLIDTRFADGQPHARLYHTLRWGLAVIAVLSALVLLAHVLPVTSVLQNLLDRLFMLLAIPILLLLLRGRRFLLSPLQPLLSATWLRITERLYLALTVTLLASATLGVLGYINLAWSISTHIGWLLLVLAGWLLLRGLVRDAFGRSKNYIACHRATLDWVQPLLISAEWLSQIALFVLAVWVVFQIYGWGAESAPVRAINQVLFSPLFVLGERPLNVMSLLITATILIVVMRFARWSRDATYRWLFVRIANTGARHSLSVFTQYLVVLVGFLIALRLLGIDLTTLTVFAGALGVGMGLGLQGIANNFISGVLLLLERPLRTGDTVTICNNEGAVTHIGLRSLTVKTWDNQEVIIPNSEVISHPFTNWTYSDNVVRTALTVSIHQQNDIHQAHTLITQALKGHPDILLQPPPEVWLDTLGPASVTFRIQYFTDLRSANRQKVKSNVLFMIWDHFQQAGIHLPGGDAAKESAVLPPPSA